MDKEIELILVKFFIITALVIAYVLIISLYVVPTFIEPLYGQDWKQFVNKTSPYCCFFLLPEAYGQNQFSSQPYSDPNAQQYGGQYGQFSDQYNQGFNNQYQQPYGSGFNNYQQPYGYQQQNPYGGMSIQQIIAMILTGAGGAGAGKYAADRRTKQLEELHRETMEAELKTKQQLADLARVSFQNMPQKGNEIQDAPSVKLETLNSDIDQFREKVAKA